eukprot:m.89613 g.89613  ORF g.89613 m.89613 type:complete len:397 (+) comp8835_c6_seq1:62-1252(+)
MTSIGFTEEEKRKLLGSLTPSMASTTSNSSTLSTSSNNNNNTTRTTTKKKSKVSTSSSDVVVRKGDGVVHADGGGDDDDTVGSHQTKVDEEVERRKRRARQKKIQQQQQQQRNGKQLEQKQNQNKEKLAAKGKDDCNENSATTTIITTVAAGKKGGDITTKRGNSISNDDDSQPCIGEEIAREAALSKSKDCSVSESADDNDDVKLMEKGGMDSGDSNVHSTVKEGNMLHGEIPYHLTLEKVEERKREMEEDNKRKQTELMRTIQSRRVKAITEANKLNQIQSELASIQRNLSEDISILRSKIESASREYFQARKRYDMAEKEFVEAKIELHKKEEIKDHLTEHLLVIIEKNEERKALKLQELLNKVASDEGNQPNTTSPANADGNSKINNSKSNK